MNQGAWGAEFHAVLLMFATVAVANDKHSNCSEFVRCIWSFQWPWMRGRCPGWQVHLRSRSKWELLPSLEMSLKGSVRWLRSPGKSRSYTLDYEVQFYTPWKTFLSLQVSKLQQARTGSKQNVPVKGHSCQGVTHTAWRKLPFNNLWLGQEMIGLTSGAMCDTFIGDSILDKINICETK